jgi:hypothetical protein
MARISSGSVMMTTQLVGVSDNIIPVILDHGKRSCGRLFG